MKSAVSVIVIVALATIAITGCQVVIGAILDPDFTVESIDVDTDATGEIVGVTITFYNSGGAAKGVEFTIYLLADSNVNPTAEFKVFEDTIDIEWRQNQEVSVGVASDILPFLEAQASSPPPGEDYYVRVSIDPDNRIEERDETDNILSAEQPERFGTLDPGPDPAAGPGFDFNLTYSYSGPLTTTNPLKVVIFDVSTDVSQAGVFPLDGEGDHRLLLSEMPFDDPGTTEFYMEFVYDSANDWNPGDAPGLGDVAGSYDTASSGEVDYSGNVHTTIVLEGSYSITFSPPTGPPVDAYENDDTPGLSNDLGLNTTQQRTFHDAGDIDWLRIQANLGETIIVRTTAGAGSASDTELWVYDDTVPFQGGFDPYTFGTYTPLMYSDDDADPNGTYDGQSDTWITHDDANTSAPYSSVEFLAPYEGYYYVRVADYDDEVGSYDIYFYANPPAEAGFDFNLTYSHSGLLNSSNPFKVIIYDVNATDWGQAGVYPLDQPGDHRLLLSEIPFDDPGTVEFYLEFVYDSANDWFPGGSLGPGDEIGSYDTASPGNVDYFNDYYTTIVLEGSYSITYNPPVDAYEYDNTHATARSVAPPSSGEFHTFGSATDEDWFWVSLETGEYLNVDTSSTGGSNDCDTIIELWDSMESTLLDSNDDGGPGVYSSLSYQALGAAAYYVKVREFYGGPGEYILDISTNF